MNPTPDIEVVIVTHNGARVLPRAMRSLSASEGARVRVTVVDNGSTDASDELAADLGATVVALETNVGYGAAFNIGLEQTTSEWIVCSNQDVDVAPTALAIMIDAAARHQEETGRPCVAAPGLFTPTGRLAETCHRFPTPTRHIAGLLLGEAVSGIRDVEPPTGGMRRCDWVSGAFLLGRTATFNAVAGFDPTYFMYVEDLDFFTRLAAAGADCLWVPEAIVVHAGGGAPIPAAIYAHTLWNLRAYYRRHNGPRAGAAVFAAGIVGSMVRAAMWYCRGLADDAVAVEYSRMFAGAALVALTSALHGRDLPAQCPSPVALGTRK